MALNVNTLITRSISSVVFVIILLGSILWNYISFSILFYFVSIIALNEYYKIAEKLGAMPYKKTGYICATVSYLIFLNIPSLNDESPLMRINSLKPFIVIIPLIMLLISIFDKNEQPIRNAFYTLSGLIYSVLPFILMNQLVYLKNDSNTLEYNPQLLLGVIFLIWANDTFAYLGGSIFGKHKMIERVSPGKTWEGTLFGIIVALILSFTFKQFLSIPYQWIWPVFGICVPVLATIGDLVESLLKRQAGIKDSGQLMPGHGGALDRFDSLIFVTPFVFAILQLL